MSLKKNVKLNEYTYSRVKNLSDASIDKNLNLLMDKVEDKMPIIPYGEKTRSVSAYSDTYEKIDSFRITLGESRDNIITRMLLIYDELDEPEVIEIPFKLTSPLNKKLILEGVTNLNEITILTEDNSTEYVAWQKLLNWNEIISLIQKHQGEMVSFTKPNYKIDINYR